MSSNVAVFPIRDSSSCKTTLPRKKNSIKLSTQYVLNRTNSLQRKQAKIMRILRAPGEESTFEAEIYMYTDFTEYLSAADRGFGQA